MSHDFAKSRRPAPAPQKKKKRVTTVPAWLSVLLGTFAGALVMYLVYVSGYVPPLPDRKAVEQKTAVPAETPAATKSKSAKEPPAPPKRTSPVFEFYTKLPASGTPTVDTAALPDAQVPVSPAQPAEDMDPIQQLLAQQEAQKQQAMAAQGASTQGAATQSATTQSAAAQSATTQGVSEQGLPSAEVMPDVAMAPDANNNTVDGATAAATEKPAEVKPLTAANTETVAKPGSRYALQAGAFRKRNEADALRAKLALLGVKASIQPVTNAKGETMHRVVAGPFASAEDMDDAKIILNGNHINTIPVK